MGYLLEELNDKPFQKLDGCRRSWFETQDRPAMRPLPQHRYVYAEWKKARVHIDYHVEVHQHYYSVPYRFVKQQVDVRVTDSTVECFYKGDRIASHLRSWVRGGHTTVKAHMPPNHRHYAKWTPERMRDWAARTGPATEQVVAEIMARRSHPQQGYRATLGILRLGDAYGPERLEAASKRAIALGTYRYQSIAYFLKAGLDQQSLPTASVPPPTILHDNIRGAEYYTSETTPAPTNQKPTC